MIHITHGFSRVTHGFKHMSDRVALLEGRAMPRLALTGLALIWVAGCSADVTRFEASSNPFSNPFSSQTAQATPPAPAAPSGHVASAPLAPATSVASAPLPSAPVAAPAPVAAASAQPVRGSAAGWSAVGGTPVVVGSGETLDTLSRRYGVPASALLSANGLSSAAEVKSGMRVVVPVYSAGSRAVASAKDAGKETVEADAKTKKHAEDVAANDDGKARKAEEKKADKTKTEEKTASLKSEPARKTEPTTVAKADTEKSDAAKTTIAKKQGIDNTPTGDVDPKAATAKEPITSAQADASGSNPEFRWPARGRIIQGFKAGGNDGIDISVPEGTSVRAAESGEVVYAGDGLKGYGNLVLIKHPNGYVTAYANNAELDVKKGEQVKRGQIIAKSGDTGNVNAPQLHFELRKGSTPVDPTNYLAGL
jgi:murein DD-endopeptidase MepM/ murein hydrolase activator NlpD